MKKDPKYNIKDVIALYKENPVDFSVIPFWKPFVNGYPERYGCFSQWYKTDFSDGVVSYNCAEQYMMYQKALLFNDTGIAQQILKEKLPYKMKNLGRLIKNYNQTVWDENKYGIVFSGNMMKFTQNEHIQSILLNTKNHILCEASPYDSIWGIGIEAHKDEVNDPSYWPIDAHNLLGFALMEVRDVIRG